MGHAPAGAAAQFFCETPSQSGTSGELGLASDTYDECVYREDTLVLLELTTRDMMEVLQAFSSVVSYGGCEACWQVLWSCDGTYSRPSSWWCHSMAPLMPLVA